MAWRQVSGVHLREGGPVQNTEDCLARCASAPRNRQAPTLEQIRRAAALGVFVIDRNRCEAHVEG